MQPNPHSSQHLLRDLSNRLLFSMNAMASRKLTQRDIVTAIDAAAQDYEEGTTHPLTPRERTIVDCFVDGQCIKAIAADLGMSANTVRFHRRRIARKLHCHTTQQFLLRMGELQLIRALQK